MRIGRRHPPAIVMAAIATAIGVLPFVPDSFGAVKAKWNDDNGLLGIYRRTVDLKRPKLGERTALVFESCFWACGYYVNGSRVGSSTGGYLPVRLDVTDAVHTGTNTIAVMVDNRVSTMGEYARPVQGLYWNWGGLLQQARLERTPSVALTETRAEGTGRVTGQNGAVVYGSAGTQVLSAPRGDRVPLALDAGTATSRLLSTYRRLSPSDGWDAKTGYGWVGSGPQSRDRGGTDDLRRDIVTDTARRTLRVAVPAGVHDVYLLVGDHGFATDAMTVSRDGRTLTHLATPLPADAFTWLKFSVDGGQSGQDVDLDFTADNPGQYWRLAGLVVNSGR